MSRMYNFASINEQTDSVTTARVLLPQYCFVPGYQYSECPGRRNKLKSHCRSYQDINNFVPHCLRSTERASSCACMGLNLLIKPDWIQNCMHFAKKHYNTRSIKSINRDLKAAIHIKYGSTGQIKITYSIWQGVRYMTIHTLLMYGMNKVWSKIDLEL